MVTTDIVIDAGKELGDFGTQLKKMRKEKKLTQAQLADLSGISVMSIRRYESSQRHPGLEEMIKLGQVLGFVISVDAELSTSMQHKMIFDENYESQLKEMLLTNQRFNNVAKVWIRLNQEGQQKALETISMISKIPEYQNYSVGGMEENGQPDE